MNTNEFSHISFAVRPFEGTFAVTPILNGMPLAEVIQAFESAKGFEPAGGYGGLIPQWFKYGPLDRYFVGDFDHDSYFGRSGYIYLLGCSCGEVGCWPLAARVKCNTDTIVWNSFKQPHRPTRDYSQFGPFIFRSADYLQAVGDLQGQISSRVPTISQEP